MKEKKNYMTPDCDAAALESAAMLAASYGEDGGPGSYNLGDDILFPKPF